MSRISTDLTNHVAENTLSSELPPMSTTTGIPLDDMPPKTTEETEEETVKETTEEEEEEEEEKQFDDSTHGYLIYFDDHKDWNNLFLAAFMWFIQMFLYSLLWSEAMGLVKDDQVEVTIGFSDCSDANFDDKSLPATAFQCEASSETKWYNAVLPFILLSVYSQPDIISCFAIIFGSKKSCFKRVMALVVFAEGAFALFTGLLWCFQGVYKGSGYDAIVNSIGVLFIHDLDEQLFAAIQKMESSRLKQCFAKCCKRCTCCHNFCSLLCTFLFIVVVAGCGQVVAELAYSNTDGPQISDADVYVDDGSAGSYASASDYGSYTGPY